MNKVYMDNAATTRLSEVSMKATIDAMENVYGNPSSMHGLGHQAAKALREARQVVADILNGDKDEVYFTSGGSEADNWAIRGAAYLGKKKGKTHLITTNFEHHAVLHTMAALEKEGFTVTYIPVDEKGMITSEQVKDAITDETALVSIMTANNEIGSILPVKEIGAICKDKGVLFHTDAVQALGHIPMDVKDMSIDMLSASGHKFNGPKGVGVLYIRKGIRLPNLIEGGAQERGRRAGTENVPAIIGMAAALKDASDNMEKENARLSKMRDRLIEGILKMPYTRINGSLESRLPGNVNACFEGIEGEALLLSLDFVGICGSSGSACTSGSLDPSHVLLAIGLPHEIAHGSLRLSLGKYNTEDEVDYVLDKLPGIVERLRDMSPVWEKMMKGDK
ncbi:MAG: cysteine desulfurase NifS [Ruminococcaceae bacterium]|nr:cysteine desulfurase NifS [Oscillospiraceae bacterium]